jgi:uncharacterized phage infection (PIP) family protein YhgE
VTEITDLKKEIEILNKKQEKIISLAWTFYRGIFYGLGFFVGGTVIVGILIYVLSFFNTAPIIGEYISKILMVAGLAK